MAASDARPLPRKGVAYRVYFPILDADGDLVSGASDLDSEVSLDGAAFADATNEATEIGSSGMYYLDLTAVEMDADAVTILVKTSTPGAKTTPITLYPEEAGDVRANAVQLGGQPVTAAAPVTVPASIGTSTYDGSDTPGTGTLLERILGTLAVGTHQPQSGDAFARVGAAGAGLTALGDTRLANLDAAVSSRSTLTAQQVWEYGTRTLSSFGSLAADAATAVWGATTRTLTAISDSAGVTTLLSRLSAAWAALLDVAVSSVGSPAGTGDNPVTITVVNAADDAPIAGLTVTAWNSAITARLAYGTTDSNGQVGFNLAAGDIKIAIGTTPSWVAHDAVPYTVTGDGAQDVPTIELTAQSVTPPASASTVVGVLDVYDENGDLTSGITISAQMIRAPGAAGQSHESTVFTGTSNASGRVEMTFTRGAQYRIWRGTGERAIFTAPATGNSFSLPEILGTP